MMPPIPIHIAPKVASLVRLLASDQDGEALGAARALGRTLAGAGASFHDLAEAVEQPPAPRASRGHKQSADGPQWSLERRFTVASALRKGLAAGLFNTWEEKFATDIIGKITTSARPQNLTSKQAETVNALMAKVAEAPR